MKRSLIIAIAYRSGEQISTYPRHGYAVVEFRVVDHLHVCGGSRELERANYFVRRSSEGKGIVADGNCRGSLGDLNRQSADVNFVIRGICGHERELYAFVYAHVAEHGIFVEEIITSRDSGSSLKINHLTAADIAVA